jgi:YD repeat-containing protein
MAFAYDARDWLTAVSDPEGRGISYAYDAAGNRTRVTVPSGTTTTAYDALNRPLTVTDAQGGETRYTYDAVGNRTGLVYPNGTRAGYTYDRRNRVTAITHRKADGTVLAGFTYTLGPSGHRTRFEEASGRISEYGYDALYRLVEEKVTDPVHGDRLTRYTYDSVGNRLAQAENGVTAA